MELSICNVSKVYPNGKKALEDISLELASPCLIGLLGPNGAGKSTLMKLLVAGLLPSSGELLVNGAPLLKKEKELKATLGYLPQDFGLYDELTVWQFLDYMTALKGIENSWAAIERAMEQTNLLQQRNIRVGTLSGGQRQRVGLAQALLGEPEFLIFDEPTVGLDPEERIKIRNLFSRIAQDRLVLLSTHIIEDVQSVAGRLVVIHNGRILFDGRPEALIARAHGHVGVFEEELGAATEEGLHITARVNTARGVACRVVAEFLPAYAQTVEPTLEDAYMYLIERGSGQS